VYAELGKTRKEVARLTSGVYANASIPLEGQRYAALRSINHHLANQLYVINNTLQGHDNWSAYPYKKGSITACKNKMDVLNVNTDALLSRFYIGF
jgi:hypothetical protein